MIRERLERLDRRALAQCQRYSDWVHDLTGWNCFRQARLVYWIGIVFCFGTNLESFRSSHSIFGKAVAVVIFLGSSFYSVKSIQLSELQEKLHIRAADLGVRLPKSGLLRYLRWWGLLTLFWLLAILPSNQWLFYWWVTLALTPWLNDLDLNPPRRRKVKARVGTTVLDRAFRPVLRLTIENNILTQSPTS